MNMTSKKRQRSYLGSCRETVPAPCQSCRVLDVHKRSPLFRLRSAPLAQQKGKETCVIWWCLQKLGGNVIYCLQKAVTTGLRLVFAEFNSGFLPRWLGLYVKLSIPAFYMMDPDQGVPMPMGNSQPGWVTNAMFSSLLGLQLFESYVTPKIATDWRQVKRLI